MREIARCYANDDECHRHDKDKDEQNGTPQPLYKCLSDPASEVAGPLFDRNRLWPRAMTAKTPSARFLTIAPAATSISERNDAGQRLMKASVDPRSVYDYC